MDSHESKLNDLQAIVALIVLIVIFLPMATGFAKIKDCDDCEPITVGEYIRQQNREQEEKAKAYADSQKGN
jgi:hypothetical protein